jgi:cyanophycinase-like exopeptidase
MPERAPQKPENGFLRVRTRRQFQGEVPEEVDWWITGKLPMIALEPGPVILFGSGETSPSGRRIFQWLFRQLPQPPQLAILETPAGFEPNSDRVAGKIREFLEERLQNFQPRIQVVAARKRGTPFSPDDPDIVTPLYTNDAIFLGPGSPTYAARQLQDSLAWQVVQARHRLGGILAMASAASIAASCHTLPVYEIYKVGEDLHWKPGLDFFGPYGLSLVFIPHWNNNDGGQELDTSRCYMGQDRFAQLLEMLPADQTIVGIDEHTGLVLDLPSGCCHVLGRGNVTILRQGRVVRFESGVEFSLAELGPYRETELRTGIADTVWSQAQHMLMARATELPPVPSAEVLDLVEQRQDARARKDWATSDALRERIAAAGWEVRDTPEGPQLTPHQKAGDGTQMRAADR